MYCVRCGVELADSERACPLCGTPVVYPGYVPSNERPYPLYKRGVSREAKTGRGINFIISVAILIAAVICTLCDMNVNMKIDWSDYVIGALLLAYVVIVLPGWFRKPSPAIFVPCDFLAAALYLLYIDIRLDGGWFLPFAMPVVAELALIVCTVTILVYYIKAGYLYIFGGAFIALSIFFVITEMLINYTFSLAHRLLWSPYPAATFFILGGALIIIAIVRPFRESLYKIFSI